MAVAMSLRPAMDAVGGGLRRRLALLALGAAALASSGCVSGVPRCAYQCGPKPIYALVEYRDAAEQGTVPRVEVTDTPRYKEDHQSFRSAAIRLPDSCRADAAAHAAGVSRRDQTQTILSTLCGVWLAELERALTQNGFRVLSWDAIWQLHTQRGISAYEAARQLGADVIYVFNSLDVSDISAGGNAGMSFKYYASDERGQVGAPLALDEPNRAALRDFIKATSGNTGAKGIDALSCTLDSTAIVTTTGEAIWFFRRTVVLPVTSVNARRFLFANLEGRWMPAIPDAPQPAAPVPQAPRLSTEDVQLSQVSYTPNDPFAVQRLALIRAAATDFVQNFRLGGGK